LRSASRFKVDWFRVSAPITRIDCNGVLLLLVVTKSPKGIFEGAGDAAPGFKF
jgi:hypothetical protein